MPADRPRPRPRRFRWRRWPRWPAPGIRARAALAALLASALAFAVAAPLIGAAVRGRLDRVALERAWTAMENVTSKVPDAPDEQYQGISYAVATEDGQWLRSANLADPRTWDPSLRLPPVRPDQAGEEGSLSLGNDIVTVRYPEGHPPNHQLAELGPGPYRFVRTLTQQLTGEQLARYADGFRNGGFVRPNLPDQQLTVYVLIDPLTAARTGSTVTRLLLQYAAPAASLFVALIAWLATGLALRPVESIRRQMAAVRDGAFHERVPVPRARDGVHRLARTTNDTLDRLQHALDEQRRLVADASHELRSPLAALRNSLEVPLTHPAAADWPGVVAGALTDTQRLQDLADDLLLLARVEQDTGHPGGSGGGVDLHDLIAEQLAERAHTDPELTFEGRLGEVVLPGREVLPARLVRNLLDNAARHARHRVAVTLAVEDGRAVLTVEDDGPGIPAADRERVFERFVRLDAARDRDSGGAGLGLALVRTIAHRFGGTATAEPPGRLPGARLVVRLPHTVPRKAV
ncbi:sensor histidine kinase [Kitasatospora sp. NPDC088134]|uniref:sensor histidine kinase n=1 Tax=Kitasatospora sp. NPDC088134 TaxID=3364071 RepID=UPI0038050EE9